MSVSAIAVKISRSTILKVSFSKPYSPFKYEINKSLSFSVRKILRPHYKHSDLLIPYSYRIHN
ncbi:hypothetical protein LEP1GSC137_2053 [Leptospira borgpetersenii str. Noumea 25]|nr:hypothetical protein LEP1GSC137_2053 [Leptospira borgpetersenii str. Noumea 25]OOV43378.1 hypothetical protein B1H38_12905 [Leptospira borgpetersenii serovar Ballum]